MMMMMMIYYHFLSQINASSEVRLHLQSVLKNVGTEILNNLNTVRNMCNKCLTLNFITIKFKELLAEELMYNKTVATCMALFFYSKQVGSVLFSLMDL